MNKYFCLYNHPHIPIFLFSYNKETKRWSIQTENENWGKKKIIEKPWQIHVLAGTHSESLAKWSI